MMETIDNKWWGQAISTATYLRNQSLTRANLKALTPHEKFTGKKPDLSNVCTFGCKVFVHINNPKMGKLDTRAVEGVLLGYGKNTKGWIINVPSTKKTIISQNIEFFKKINKLPIKVSIGSSKRKDPKPTAVQPTTAPSPKKPEPKQVVIPSSLTKTSNLTKIDAGEWLLSHLCF